MVDLKKIQFKGYFIHKNDSVTYKLLYIYENDEETTLKNLISIQEEDFAILYKKGNHIFIEKLNERNKELKKQMIKINRKR